MHLFVWKKEIDYGTGQIDKFTVVIWVEGDDPECLDDIIGGEMKMHMEITEESISNKEVKLEKEVTEEKEIPPESTT